MSVFGFIENFFLISLGIVFMLILLLVYHFKNRMSVAEKKSESMYGLLSAVVKEIKSLRSMFGLGVTSTTISKEDAREEDETCSESANIPKFTEDYYNTPIKSVPEVLTTEDAPTTNVREVITLDLNASEPTTSPKIVVSDEESESESEESDEESDSEESDKESDLEDDDSEPEPEENELGELEVKNLDISPESSSTPAELLEPEEVVDLFIPEEPAADPKSIPSVEQLRKMNINQLKTIAIELGVQVDTSKMKKPELIGLIQSK